MKIPKIVIATFLIAFLTSFLLDMEIIVANPVRYWLVVGFIAVELIFGVVFVVSVIKQMRGDTN